MDEEGAEIFAERDEVRVRYPGDDALIKRVETTRNGAEIEIEGKISRVEQYKSKVTIYVRNESGRDEIAVVVEARGGVSRNAVSHAPPNSKRNNYLPDTSKPVENWKDQTEPFGDILEPEQEVKQLRETLREKLVPSVRIGHNLNERDIPKFRRLLELCRLKPELFAHGTEYTDEPRLLAYSNIFPLYWRKHYLPVPALIVAAKGSPLRKDWEWNNCGLRRFGLLCVSYSAHKSLNYKRFKFFYEDDPRKVSLLWYVEAKVARRGEILSSEREIAMESEEIANVNDQLIEDYSPVSSDTDVVLSAFGADDEPRKFDPKEYGLSIGDMVSRNVEKMKGALRKFGKISGDDHSLRKRE